MADAPSALVWTADMWLFVANGDEKKISRAMGEGNESRAAECLSVLMSFAEW